MRCSRERDGMTGSQTCNYGVDERAVHVSEPLSDGGGNINHWSILLRVSKWTSKTVIASMISASRRGKVRGFKTGSMFVTCWDIPNRR